MQINASTAEQIAQLLEKYCLLSQPLQNVLRVMAVIWLPLPRHQLNLILDKLSESKQFSRPVVSLTDASHSQLANQGFLQAGEQFCELSHLLKQSLIREAVANNEYKRIRHLQTSLLRSLQNRDIKSQHMQDSLRVLDYFYLQEYDNLLEQLKYGGDDILFECCFLPFTKAHLIKLRVAIRLKAAHVLLQRTLSTGGCLDFAAKCIRQLNYDKDEQLNLCEAQLAFYRADWDLFEQLSQANNPDYQAIALRAAADFVHAKIDLALAGFKQAIQAKNQQHKRRKNQFLSGPLGLFYKLCLLVKGAQGHSQQASEALAQIDFERDKSLPGATYLPLSRAMRTPILALQNLQSTHHSYQLYQKQLKIHQFCADLITFALATVRLWCNKSLNSDDHQFLTASIERFEHTGANLFVTLAKNLLNTAPPNKGKLIALNEVYSTKTQWQLALSQLSGEPVESDQRIIWRLGLQGDRPMIQCDVQRVGANGQWQHKNALSKAQLLSETYVRYLTAQDRQIRQLLRQFDCQQKVFTSHSPELIIALLQALLHTPKLYTFNDANTQLQLSERAPFLQVTEVDEQICLSMPNLPSWFNAHSPIAKIRLVSDSHFQFSVFSFAHLRVAEVIGEEGLLVPKHAKQEVLETIQRIAPQLDILSEQDTLSSGLAQVPCQSGLYVDIQPYLDGLKFSCFVMPFGAQGPSYPPAQGLAWITAQVAGQALATQRDLNQEQLNLDLLDQYCPGFLAMHGDQLILSDHQKALDLLTQLEAFTHHPKPAFKLTIRWPKGKKISLSPPLNAAQIQLAIYKKQQWFDYTGQVEIDDSQTINFQKLLNLYQQQGGKYIELAPQHFLTLSEDLQKKLDLLQQISEHGRFHPLASPLVDKAIQGMRLKTLHGWEQQKDRMHKAWRAKLTLPAGLHAQLRPYQAEGVRWALRLGMWQAGACLADEMGLGKTLQAIAVLLSRQQAGPSLVFAPASVVYNWQSELTKFAPELSVYSLSQYPDQASRTEIINHAKPGDLVLVSYGLLLTLAEPLQAKQWNTLIADEAQLLKNPLSRRTKAVYEIPAEFKMITTGTPLENDLTELWSLFRIINPGLLGNIKRFTQKFIKPIQLAEEDPAAAAQAHAALTILIRPFILRRTKQQVAADLPQKTEISLPLVMQDEHASFYQAVRLNALDKIQKSQQEQAQASQNAEILAQLTRLRQACCDPRLLVSDTDINNTKLEKLEFLLEQILSVKQQVLIFSQFVGFLKIVRQWLADKNIGSNYLDGSTPSEKRQQQIAQFQAGEQPVFLISLKAGGTGLNLTAASYVIHLDPWWNPAVSQQASDRAHRIGQQQPVTVYHLYCEKTIEAQIIKMHSQKKSLADDVLRGHQTISESRVSEILNLLKTPL